MPIFGLIYLTSINTFLSRPSHIEFKPPIYKYGPHISPLGILFYTGNMFPAKYKNKLFVTEHGSILISDDFANKIYRITYERSLIEEISNWFQSLFN